MPSPEPRPEPSHRRLPQLAAVWVALALCTASACSSEGDGEEPGAAPTSTSPGGESGAPSTSGTGSEPDQTAQQPPLPADPSGYTADYVQATLAALYQDHQRALVAYHASGAIDETVRAAMANVYHPDVFDQQIRNLEDYFPAGENLEDPPGGVQIEVTGVHSVSADCILAITTYDIDAVTTLDAPVEENFFLGLARNPQDADGTHPWLITVEYTTSDGEPLPEDVCA